MKAENDEFGASGSDLQTSDDLLTSSQLENCPATGLSLRPAGRVSGSEAPGSFVNLQENKQTKKSNNRGRYGVRKDPKSLTSLL